MVRELGTKRRETVWPLSTVKIKNKGGLILVREDRKEQTNSVPIIDCFVYGYRRVATFGAENH